MLRPAAANLTGVKVLVVRPRQQIEGLCDAIAAAGGQPLPLPLQGIERLPASAALIAPFERYRNADRWLFTSSNAVDAAIALFPPPWPAVAAVGDATAAALRSATGAASVLTPTVDFSAGALLELPEFAVVKGRRYLVVTGASARVDIAATLRARGADAGTATVYRRIMLDVAPAQIGAQLASADLAVVTSGEALRRLVDRVPDALRGRLMQLQLVVASARMVELAKELGFITAPLVPQSIAVSAFVDALAAGSSRRKLP